MRLRLQLGEQELRVSGSEPVRALEELWPREVRLQLGEQELRFSRPPIQKVDPNR